MKNAKIAGDIGDVIYSLATVRYLGCRSIYLHAEAWTREPMSTEKVASLKSLLEGQPCIDKVRWVHELPPGESIEINLNDFRAHYTRAIRKPDFPKERNLCEWIMLTHGVPMDEQHKAWLEVPKRSEAPVIINRTFHPRPYRYHNPQFPWTRVLETYKNKCALIGTRVEHEAFCRDFGSIPRIETPTLLEVAQVIAGSELFIGNQSCAYAIAEGLKHPAILEVYPQMPNCLFRRPNVIHGWNDRIELPEV